MQALGVSGDGVTVVGYCSVATAVSDSTDRAFRWTAADGTSDLGTLPGGNNAVAYAANVDGSVIVGLSGSSVGTRACLWTSSGTTDLGVFPGGNESYATGVSEDGQVVVGTSNRAGSERAFRWTRDSGLVDLGTVEGAVYSDARGVSADGAATTGLCYFPAGNYRAFRAIRSSGMDDLGTLEGDRFSIGYALSADGSVVVGVSINADFTSRRAFLWTSAIGMVDLNTYLPTVGVVFPGWRLLEARGIDAAGSTLTGWGTNPCNQVEAWRVQLDPLRPPGRVCTADFNADADLNADDLADYINCFFSLPACLRAEFDGECGVNADDLADFINAFFAGCA